MFQNSKFAKWFNIKVNASNSILLKYLLVFLNKLVKIHEFLKKIKY